MLSLQVGELTFQFPDSWQVNLFDDGWSFYRNQFQSVCGGAKAVDIFAINTESCFWMIEVKDYRQHRRTKVIKLADEVAAKVRDSLACLVAAQMNANNAEEKSQAINALRCSRLRVVLHLEQPEKHSKLFPRSIDPANVRQQLKQRIKAIDPHPLVLETARMGNVPWIVN